MHSNIICVRIPPQVHRFFAFTLHISRYISVYHFGSGDPGILFYLPSGKSILSCGLGPVYVGYTEWLLVSDNACIDVLYLPHSYHYVSLVRPNREENSTGCFYQADGGKKRASRKTFLCARSATDMTQAYFRTRHSINV